MNDPAGTNIDVRGWCKLSGVAGLGLFLACAGVVVNLGLLDAFEARKLEAALNTDGRRFPRQGRRRRRT